MKELFNIMEKLSLRVGRHQFFSDFLDIIICTLSMGAMEDKYLSIISRYDKKQVDNIVKAYSLLIIEMDNKGEGLKDVLGAYYDEYLANHAAGQFFTPDCVCELMSELVSPKFAETVQDCACGSGRMLLNSAKKSRFTYFYAADISELCAKMTLINLCLNGLFGEVAWMDSLSLKMWGAWKVGMHPKGCPYILEIPIEQSRMYAPPIETVEKKVNNEMKNKPKQEKQLLLFE